MIELNEAELEAVSGGDGVHEDLTHEIPVGPL